jgi:hypothetical protein
MRRLACSCRTSHLTRQQSHSGRAQGAVLETRPPENAIEMNVNSICLVISALSQHSFCFPEPSGIDAYRSEETIRVFGQCLKGQL